VLHTSDRQMTAMHAITASIMTCRTPRLKRKGA
jgi:hypothetical protein